MGCDIHMYAEKLVDGKWQKLTGFKNQYSENADEPYETRNYTLFARLAGVRNGRGFAGCDTGDAVVPISDPKGLPEDVSEDVRRESDEWGVDGHSHSWLSLSEILAADLDNFETVNRGFVQLDEFRVFVAKRHPERWCGGGGGPMIRHISNDAMRKIADGVDPEKALEFERRVPLKSWHTFNMETLISYYFPGDFVKYKKVKALLSAEEDKLEAATNEAIGVLFPDKAEKRDALMVLAMREGPEAENARMRLEELRKSVAKKMESYEEFSRKMAIEALYTRIEWVSTGEDSYGCFMTETIPQLMARSSASRALGEGPKDDSLAITKLDPEAYNDISVVFWFDN